MCVKMFLSMQHIIYLRFVYDPFEQLGLGSLEVMSISMPNWLELFGLMTCMQ